MRAERLNLSFFAPTKLCGGQAVNRSEIPYWGKRQNVIGHFKTIYTEGKIIQGQFEVNGSFAIRRRNEFYLIGQLKEGPYKKNGLLMCHLTNLFQ